MLRPAVVCFFAINCVLAAQTDPGPVDLTNRESARTWFNTWWPKTTGAALGFTGNIDTGVAGDISQGAREQTLLRINIYRRMVGVQPVTMSDDYNFKAQAAAVLCAANNDLSHSPPSTWKFYNPVAAEGCRGCELTSSAIPHGIVDFMIDFGPNNQAVGHRSGVLEPGLEKIGIGSAPGHSSSVLRLGVTALWDSIVTAEPRLAEPFLTWPTKGYTPFYLFPGRWSIEIPDVFTTAFATFEDASIALTKNGQSVPVTTWMRRAGSGMIFTLDGTSEGRSENVETVVNGEGLEGLPVQSSDVTYHVKVSNIKVRATGALWNGTGVYEYDVIGYNPAVARVVPGQAANLINISTRSFAGAESNVQIAGFIMSGSAPRKVLIRAGGPYLSQFQVPNTLADPVLTLFSGSTLIMTNDDWSSDAANIIAGSAKAGALPFSAGSKDAAIVATLQPGVPYTAQVSGKSGATGNAIVEVYDIDDGSSSNLINISTRSFVGSGDNLQIGGFILRGPGPRKVLIRAGGPYLSQYGVPGVLADPVLTVFNGSTQIAQNDDWSTLSTEVAAATQVVKATAFAPGSKDAAIVLTLNPNIPYTAQVAGKNGSTGNALIEIFQLPDTTP